MNVVIASINWGNIIAVAALALIIGYAVYYIIRAKKRGAKCIGCPEGCCSAKKDENSSCGCCCGCGNNSQAD